MSEQIAIRINTGNAAFDDEPAAEIARILRKLADSFERDGAPGRKLYDINGNHVGTVEIEEGA